MASRAGLSLSPKPRRTEATPRNAAAPLSVVGPEPTVADLGGYCTWSGTTSAEGLRHPPGVQVTRASGPEDPGGRLGRRCHSLLGRCEGDVQVDRIWGMTCSVLPIRDSQPHSQLARCWPRSARPAGLTVTLCPATCSLTEMVTGPSDRSGMAEPIHVGSRSPDGPLGSRACGRSRWPWSGRARAGADRSARRCAPAGLFGPEGR